VLVDYLLKSYIVWPWDVTSDANKTRLKKWWCDIFPALKLPDLQAEDCPGLIEIMLRARRVKPGCFQSEYQCQVLQRCDLLPQAKTRSTLEKVVETLRTFRQEWQYHQHFLVPFDFVRSTGLCPDVVIEITKYLSLVDTINAFSIVILPLLEPFETIASDSSSTSQSETNRVASNQWRFPNTATRSFNLSNF
jgi:thiamine kinase-like enzyme